MVEKAAKLSSSYIQRFARGLRAFSSWVYEDGYLDSNILKPLKPPKITQKIIEVLTDADVRRLPGGFNRDDPYGARNYPAVRALSMPRANLLIADDVGLGKMIEAGRRAGQPRRRRSSHASAADPGRRANSRRQLCAFQRQRDGCGHPNRP